MKNIQKKNLCFILVGILAFLAVAAFLALNINKPANNAFAAANSDITYTIKMSEGGNKINYGNNSVLFSPDGSGYKEGTVGGSFGTSISFIAKSEKYYEIENYTVTWEEGKNIKINDIDNNSGTLTGSEGSVEILIESLDAVSGVTVTFNFKKSSYKISAIAKYITNFKISNENDSNNVDGAEIKLTNPDGDSQSEITTVQLNDRVNLTLNDSDSTRRFIDYALWNTRGEYEKQNRPKDTLITINGDFLEKYLSAKEEILIIGAFVNVYSVKISDYAGDLSQNFIEVTLYNNVTKENIECKNKSDIEKYFGENSEPLDRGSYIRIVAKTVPCYKFSNFIDGINDPSNIEYRIDYLDKDYNITTSYSRNVYTVDNIDIKNSFGEDIKNSQGEKLSEGGGITIQVYDAETKQTNETNEFRIGDKIIITLTDALLTDHILENFFDNYFSIKKGATQKYQDLKASSAIEITADLDFIDTYLNINTNNIKIVSNFINRYSFEIAVDGDNLGSYNVSINGRTETHTGNFDKEFFNNGTIITIKLNPSKYASYNFGGVYDKKEGDVITIIINGSDRNAAISFTPKMFSLTDKTKDIEGYAVTGLDNLTVGSVITIAVSPSGNNEIKSWTFNGANVTKAEELPDNVEYSNGVLHVTVTEAWLNSLENFEITNDVNMGLKSWLLIVIIIPSVVIPLLAIILLTFIIMNAKRKKFIKAELLNEKMAKYNYGGGSMIEDLKNDNFNKISEEDIRAEMKKRKDHK